MPSAAGTVFVDAGGVLLLPDLQGMATRFGVQADESQLTAAFYAAYEKRVEGIDELEWLWRAFMQGFGLDEAIIEDHIVDLEQTKVDPWGSVVTAAPDAHWFLETMVKQGLLVTVVSNASGRVEAMLREAGLCQVGPGPLTAVHDVIDSSIVGVAKPDPGIFDIAIRRLPHPVERTDLVHIGDALWSDVRGAEAAGITPLHLDPAGICVERQSHHHVSSLREASQWLLT